MAQVAVQVLYNDAVEADKSFTAKVWSGFIFF